MTERSTQLQRAAIERPGLEALGLEALGLAPDSAGALPDALRRQIARFLLRWGRAEDVLRLLPSRDLGPRDRYDRCRALLAAGRLEEAQGVARELVNTPDAGPWGHRAVGAVFLAMGRADRADERFRSGDDPAGRARAWIALGDPDRALDLLRDAPPDDPETELARLEAQRLKGDDAAHALAHLESLLEEERRELVEALAERDPLGSVPPDADGLREALRRVFEYADFRPGQLEVILPLIRGESVLGLMPTGAGKSICFQLPAALLPGATVVISPLIALMKDQVDGLPPRLYRRATLVNSSLEPGEAERRLELVARGEVSLVYAAPERLRQRSFVRALQRRGVSLFVIDEAHCVSLWGHDFRPDYFFIRRVLQDLGRPTVLALTATATPEMQEDIGRQLDVDMRTVNLGTYRPNLHLSALKLGGDAEKWSALLALLREEDGPAIVYVDRRKLAEELADRLRQENIAAEAYHAGMDREARDRAQTRFMLGEVRVMTATVAFGMGVDKADVRVVAHYNLPRSLEAYYQEAGRAGRDGLPARCVLLYTPYDKANLTRRARQDRLRAAEVLALHRLLLARLKRGSGPVSADELEDACGGDGTRLRVGISLLQDIGALERGYDLPGSLWLARPNGAGDATFRRFAAAVGLREGAALSVPLARAASGVGLPAPEVEERLLEWQEAGWLRCRPGARGMGLRAAPDGRELQADVTAALSRVSEMDERRLSLLAQYLDSRECRPSFISRYFGGPPQRCGVCDNCSSSVVAEPRPFRAPAPASTPAFEALRAWRREKAKEEGVPAYVIFHDRVLHAIADARPRTLSRLGQIPGVGRAKLHAYGADVLAVVLQHADAES
jgi:ATP-dependent DNA helicase RecQ